MPTYEYHCDACGRDFEVRQRISEDALTTHDGCGSAVRRLISPAPFILKGEGWYVTDYPSAARKKGIESEKGGSASSSTAKSETKSETTSTPDKPAATPTTSASASPASAPSSD